MDIEKVKNYNQKMLAVITTLVVAFGVIGLFSFVFVLFTEVFRFGYQGVDYSSDNEYVEEYDPQIISESEGKISLSYHFPQLVDTANQIFLIPIAYGNADIARDVFSKEISSSRLYDDDYNYYNSFINLIIYEGKTNVKEKLFNEPILVRNYIFKSYSDDILIVFEAVDDDTNKSGKITFEDDVSLFIYSMKNRQLKQAKLNGENLLQYHFIAKTKDIIMRFGSYQLSKSNNDEIDPGILCRYDYANDRLIKITDEKLTGELKTIAEGTKK